jgi:hypothetical protein
VVGAYPAHVNPLAGTLGFEFPFGRFVEGASWQRLFAEYDLLLGRLWVLVLLSTMLAPPILAQKHRLRMD